MNRRISLPFLPFLFTTALGGCTESGALKGGAANQRQVVYYALPKTDEVSAFEEFTGHLEAVYSIDVRARVNGYLETAKFKEGDEVKENQVLFEIDPRPYKAELARTQATVLQADARVKRLEADYRRAVSNYSRGAISREEFDKVSGDYGEATGALETAKANLEMAKLNVEWTEVRAKIDGQISRRMVDPGNLIKADDTVLTSIVSTDPMWVYFDIDERTLLKLIRMVNAGQIRTREQGEIKIGVELADETEYPHEATINFSDNKLDPNTGTLRVRAVIANPHVKNSRRRMFRPGLFVKVRLPVGSPHRAFLVPEQAIGTDQGRKYVYVLNYTSFQEKGEKAPTMRDIPIRRAIEIGPTKGEMRVVESGITEGDRIVVVGLQRIRPDTPVTAEPVEKLEKARAKMLAPAAGKGGGTAKLKSIRRSAAGG
jgi:RND family efflux transporter MFP subunit